MPSTDNDISVLNSLIKTTLDSRKGFLDAAGGAEATRFANEFRSFAEERSQAAALLQGEVRRLGGNPEDDSSFLGAAHRGFMNLKELFVDRDERAIIEEVERGEDYIKDKFERALAGDELSASSRNVVEQAYGSVRAGHDRARELKHSLAS